MHEERVDIDDSRSVRGTESYGFTKDQYEQLVNQLQSSGSAANQSASSSKVNLVSHVTSGTAKFSSSLNHSNIKSWIVDSGASDHICSSLRVFYSYASITPVHIKLIFCLFKRKRAKKISQM